MAGEKIPPGLIISDVNVTNIHKVYTTESMSGKFVSRDSGVQRFKGTLRLTALGGFRGGQTLNGFLAKLRGRSREFELELCGTYASDTVITPVMVQTAASIGSTNITIGNYLGSVYSGQVFNGPNDNKMYICLDDATGNSTIEIIPQLKVALEIGNQLNFTNPVFTVVLDSNETTIEHSESGYITSATLNWFESL